MPKYLGEETQLFTTKCVLQELGEFSCLSLLSKVRRALWNDEILQFSKLCPIVIYTFLFFIAFRKVETTMDQSEMYNYYDFLPL